MKYVFTTEGHVLPLEAQKLESGDIETKTTPSVVIRALNNYTANDNTSRTFKMRKKYTLYERGRGTRKVPDLVFTSNKCSYGAGRNSSAKFYQNLLPMKIRYFDQLFDLVGVNDNLESLLERKTS